MKPINHLILTLMLLLSATVSAQQTGFPGTRTFGPVQAPAVDHVTIKGLQQPVVFVNQGPLPAPMLFPKTLGPTPAKPYELVVDRDPLTGMPVSVSFKSGSVNVSSEAEAQTLLPELIKTTAHLYGLDKTGFDGNFKTSSLITDDEGIIHVKMEQVYKGLPVYASELLMHFYPDGSVFMNGRSQPSPELTNLTPTLNKSDATTLAIVDVGERDFFRELNNYEKQLLNYTGPEAELVVWPVRDQFGRFKLVWHIEVRNSFVKHWDYFIDAHTGEILNAYDHTCAIGPTTATSLDLNGVSRTVNTFQHSNGTYYMLDASRPMFTGPTNTLPPDGSGIIITGDLQNTGTANPSAVYVTSANNVWNNPKAISAHYNSAQSYEYFRTVHGRNSINGQGGDVVSFINVADDNGQPMDNAFWNGQFMFYGNGQSAFFPLAGSLDVGAHEMSHGVIQNTANLEYQGESGAINESFADVFGAMVDRANWKLGEDVVNTAVFPTGALRDMQNPHNGGTSLNDNGWQPSHVNEQYTGTADNGGVHINSGIANHAFYLFATATSKAIAEKVYYRALAQYLTRSSNFRDLRAAVVKAAGDLHGAGSAEVTAANNAFDAVGIGGGGGTTPNPTLPTNPGTDFILITDVNTADPNTLYISDVTGSTFTPVTTSGVNFRPSITDDGEVAVFVGTDQNIHAAILTPGSIQDNTLTNDAFWSTVAVSKDGSKIAAISNQQDTSIYVYDFGLQQWGRFILYNPTTANGVTIEGVRYAEAIEWDYTGQYLVYDAYNEIPGTPSYWDVGFIHVWDNGSGNFGTGQIGKLFTGLSAGVSIGNPSFSKNSPNILAFDYFNANTNEYAVLGANIETQAVGTIWQQTVIGTPSYSRTDDRIVFTGVSNGTGNAAIGSIPLAADKINAGGNASLITEQAIWPVWFANGSRPIGVEEVNRNIGPEVVVFPNPATDNLTVNISKVNISDEIQVELLDLMGKHMASWQSTTGANNHTVNLSLTDLPSGTYLVKVSGVQGITVKKVLKY